MTGKLTVAAADARIAELKPFASARVAYRLNSRWRVDLQADGYPGSDSYLNAALLLNWRAAPTWDFGLGYRYTDWHVKDSDVYNDLETGDFLLSITHQFE